MIDQESTNNSVNNKTNEKKSNDNPDNDSVYSILTISDQSNITKKLIPYSNRCNKIMFKKNDNNENRNTKRKPQIYKKIIFGNNSKINYNNKEKEINNNKKYVDYKKNNNEKYFKIIDDKEKPFLFNQIPQNNIISIKKENINGTINDLKDKEINENDIQIKKENVKDLASFITKINRVKNNNSLLTKINPNHNNINISSSKKEILKNKININQINENNNIKIKKIPIKENKNDNHINNNKNENIKKIEKKEEVKIIRNDWNIRKKYIDNYEEDCEKDENGYSIETSYIKNKDQKNKNNLNKDIKYNEDYENIQYIIDSEEEYEKNYNNNINKENQKFENYKDIQFTEDSEEEKDKNNINKKYIENSEEENNQNDLNNLGLHYIE